MRAKRKRLVSVVRPVVTYPPDRRPKCTRVQVSVQPPVPLAGCTTKRQENQPKIIGRNTRVCRASAGHNVVRSIPSTVLRPKRRGGKYSTYTIRWELYDAGKFRSRRAEETVLTARVRIYIYCTRSFIAIFSYFVKSFK